MIEAVDLLFQAQIAVLGDDLDSGILKGEDKPDYARCVAISTAGAQKEMVLPSLLALLVPIAVGLLLDVAWATLQRLTTPRGLRI